jgi:hypothetical protein
MVNAKAGTVMKLSSVMTLRSITKCRRFSDWLSLILIAVCVLALDFGQSIAVAGGHPLLDIELQKTIMVLERGENALASSSVDLRQTLKSVVDGVPPDAPQFVRSDITTFLTRLPESGTEFVCHSEFIRYRARQELQRLQEGLLNTNPQPAEPQFCYAVPFAIDLAQPRATLEIYGSDFDAQPLELFILNADGTFEDVSFTLKKRTHYHFSVDLGPNGVKFSPKSQMLGVAWGHIVRYSVSLIQPSTALCTSQIEEIPASKMITFSPDRIGGGSGLNVGGTATARATLNYESNKVDATVCTLATDSKSDPTFVGCSVEYVYTTDPDSVIDGVFLQLESRISGLHLHPGQNTFPGKRNGPVTKWVFGIPEVQSIPAADPVMTAELGKIRISSTKLDNCLPAVTYMEARRRHDLASTTTKRLDTQSTSVPKDILKLRPRFAP